MKTSPAGNAAITIDTMKLLNFRIWVPREEMNTPSAMIVASLPISEGWMVIDPGSRIQRWAPPMTTPMKSTATRSRIENQ